MTKKMMSMSVARACATVTLDRSSSASCNTIPSSACPPRTSSAPPKMLQPSCPRPMPLSTLSSLASWAYGVMSCHFWSARSHYSRSSTSVEKKGWGTTHVLIHLFPSNPSSQIHIRCTLPVSLSSTMEALVGNFTCWCRPNSPSAAVRTLCTVILAHTRPSSSYLVHRSITYVFPPSYRMRHGAGLPQTLVGGMLPPVTGATSASV